MLVTMNFDFTNPVHAQLFTQVCAQCTSAGIPMQMHDFTSAPVAPVPTPVSTPAPAPKTYAPAEDVQCQWVQNKTLVTYTLADGDYVGQTGARKTLNARLRNAGAEWIADKKAWKFASTKKAEEFIASTSALVTAQEIEAVREKAAQRAAKKAAQA